METAQQVLSFVGPLLVLPIALNLAFTVVRRLLARLDV